MMVGLGVGAVAVGVLSKITAATSIVGDDSIVTVGTDVNVVVASTTNGPGRVGVSDSTTAGAGVEVGRDPPTEVGVVYCPHRDALPTQDAVIKETAINSAESRLTFRPFRELYLC
jgi:hypothetical protein